MKKYEFESSIRISNPLYTKYWLALTHVTMLYYRARLVSQYEHSTAKQNRLLRFYTLCLEILGNIDVVKIKAIIDSYPFMIMAFFHSNNCNSLSFGHLLFFLMESHIVIHTCLCLESLFLLWFRTISKKNVKVHFFYQGPVFFS